MPSSELTIRPAKQDDVDSIHKLAESWLLGNVENPSEQGFFVSDFPKEKYHEYLDTAEYFLVAEKDGKFAGFLLAYHCDRIQSDEVVNSLLRYTSLEPFVLVKQISSVPDARGVASSLYRKLFESMTTKYALAAVVNEPSNTRSVQFHRRLGFQHHMEVHPPADPDGKVRGRSIWCYGKNGTLIPTRIMKASDKEMAEQLIEREGTIASLYTHEDNLNWTKLGILFTLMTAFITLFAILIERDASIESNLTIPVMSLIFGGLIVNALFLGKIRSGIRFMQCHKDSMIHVDEGIRRMNPTFKPLFNSGTRGSSFTVRLMNLIPILSTLTWIACSIVLFIQFCR